MEVRIQVVVISVTVCCTSILFPRATWILDILQNISIDVDIIIQIQPRHDPIYESKRNGKHQKSWNEIHFIFIIDSGLLIIIIGFIVVSLECFAMSAILTLIFIFCSCSFHFGTYFWLIWIREISGIIKCRYTKFSQSWNIRKINCSMTSNIFAVIYLNLLPNSKLEIDSRGGTTWHWFSI